MGTYRVTNNIIASTIDKLNTQKTTDGISVTIVEGFQTAYDFTLPIIAVYNQDDLITSAEMGSTSFIRDIFIYISIFARTEIEKNDLKDWLLSFIKDGYDYKQIIMTNGTASKTTNGRVQIKSIRSNSVNFGVNKDKLSEHDQYRHLIILTCTRNNVE